MKRKPIYSLLLTGLCLFLLLPGCTKAPKGYLSGYIYYNQFVVNVPRGTTFASFNNNINAQGSTPPFNIRMTHVYDSATGKSMDSIFLKKYPSWIWTGQYNPFLDSTLDLVSSIRQQVDAPAIGLNSAGGRLEATPASINLPLGTYFFDMEVSNPAGTKAFSRIGSFRIVDPPAFNGPDNLTNYIRKVSDDSNPFNGKTPKATVTKIDSGANQRTIILKIVDKNGTPFNPAAGEIIQETVPSGASFYPTLRNYAVGVAATDTTLSYPFAVTPFPYYEASGIYTSNGTSVYYRIPTQFLLIDNHTSDLYNANIRFRVNFNINGTYLIVIKLPDITHR